MGPRSILLGTELPNIGIISGLLGRSHYAVVQVDMWRNNDNLCGCFDAPDVSSLLGASDVILGSRVKPVIYEPSLETDASDLPIALVKDGDPLGFGQA